MHCISTVVLRKKLNFKSAVIRSKRSIFLDPSSFKFQGNVNNHKIFSSNYTVWFKSFFCLLEELFCATTVTSCLGCYIFTISLISLAKMCKNKHPGIDFCCKVSSHFCRIKNKQKCSFKWGNWRKLREPKLVIDNYLRKRSSNRAILFFMECSFNLMIVWSVHCKKWLLF